MKNTALRKLFKIAAVLATLVIGVVAGFLLSEMANVLRPDYIRIEITDLSECKVVAYNIELEDKTILVTNRHINSRGTRGSSIRFIPNTDKPDKVSYLIRATYHDCEEIVSETRQVGFGWRISELIVNGEIEHTAGGIRD